jgi:nicotinate-nucleotide adenylyltransferase
MSFTLPDAFSRIGLLGGSFDPPHWGHIKTAQAAADELELDLLALVPAFQPPHKLHPTISEYVRRREMVELCLPLDPRFRLCNIEQEYQLPGTTLETVQKLRDLGFTQDRCELVWILGSDSLLDLRHWHQPEALLKEVKIAVLPRPGFAADQAESAFLQKVRLLKTPFIEISAHEIRDHRLNLEASVPPPVAQYVRRRGLYGYQG